MSQNESLKSMARDYETAFKQQKIMLSFDEFLAEVQTSPKLFIRNSADYLLDVFDHWGKDTIKNIDQSETFHYKMFDIGTEKTGPIIGQEFVQNEIVKVLKSFKVHGFISKLILLHGPNGSAKSSSVETISNRMQDFSYTKEGAIYKFSWVFPHEKDLPITAGRESSKIGFAHDDANGTGDKSFAFLSEKNLASKIGSEFRENPLYLLPMPYRQELLTTWLKNSGESTNLPSHILTSGLSKKNQQIFEALLNAYSGDLNKLYRHIQVERFFFSKQYRVGVSTVEPQMSIDAHEKQITLDRNYSNLPAFLQTISFHQHVGEIVEANRGILEFSDLLKRPLEAFKYLLGTIEKGAINFPSGTANLDIVFLATSNEKHLDAFKTIPDFSSFKGRFELIQVPYLLVKDKEREIYEQDVRLIQKVKQVTPDALNVLSHWAVMTRLKQPEVENYAKEYTPFISKLDPFTKAKLYNRESLQPYFSKEDQIHLEEIRALIWKESQGTVVYEGRFGVSPREIKTMLNRASQNANYDQLIPLGIFEEIKNLGRNRTLYDFLQFEARGRYHDVEYFIHELQSDFFRNFEVDLIESLEISSDQEYLDLLKKYVSHIAADVKKEKIWDTATQSNMEPSKNLIDEVEKIIAPTILKVDHRNQIMARLAGQKLKHPEREIDLSFVLQDFLILLKNHYYNQKKPAIQAKFKEILSIKLEDIPSLPNQKNDWMGKFFKNMYNKRAYSPDSIQKTLKALLGFDRF